MKSKEVLLSHPSLWTIVPVPYVILLIVLFILVPLRRNKYSNYLSNVP